MIETLEGPVPVEALTTSDAIQTYDNGYKSLRWVGSCHLTQAQLSDRPHLKPILIRANALGDGFPARDLMVSPQHRILVQSKIAMRMFASEEVLVPAKMLLALDGVEVVSDLDAGVRYFHLLFEQHEIIWSNGAPTESLFTGPEALRTVPKDALLEIVSLFPECTQPDFAPHAARYIPKKGKRMRKLVARHQANQRPIFQQ